jgi:hypothetical protein
MFLTGFVTVSAQAQETAPGAGPAPTTLEAPAAAAPGGYPDEYALRPLTLKSGMLEVEVPVEVNLSKDKVGKPINIPLSVGYGVNDQLELRLVHGTGLCLTGKDNDCDKVYNDVGLNAYYSFMKSGDIELAALVGVNFLSLDPSKVAAPVGVGIKYISAPLSVTVAPTVYVGLNKRDAGNKEVIVVPVQAAFQANTQLAAYVNTGIAGMADGFGDSYVIPLGVGANYLVQHGLDVGAEFTLTSLVTGADGNKALDSRQLVVFARWRNL